MSSPNPPPAPKVGDLATLYYPSDRYPFIVTAVSPNGSKLTLEELAPAASEPARYAGPFPVWDCDGDPATRTGRVITAHRKGDGSYGDGPVPLAFGHARYHRDWSD